jgi:dolichyl-phosphate-mannose-protein mannosyltransferase
MTTFSSWQKKDWLIVAVLSLISLTLFLFRLNSPDRLVFDEFWYARDGCWYVLGNRSQCDLAQETLDFKNVEAWLRDYREISPEEPPLAKWLMGIGVWIVGHNGWPTRLATVGCAVATISLLYFLAFKLFGSRTAAIAAPGLLLFDFLYFVQSRLAMLDIFVSFFVVAAYVFCVLDRDQILERRNSRASENVLWKRKWRLAAGLSLGAAAASKLSGWFVVPGILLLIAGWEIQSRRSLGLRTALRKTFHEEGLSIGLSFICIPVLVYATSYIGRLQGAILAWPWASDSWIRALIERQFFMIQYHSRAVRATVSPATLFLPMLAKPTLYSFQRSGNLVRGVLLFGNPFVWWPAFAALLVTAWRWIHIRKMDQPEGILLSGFLVNYAIWILMTWARPQVWLHYFTTTLPFSALMVGYLVDTASPKRRTIAAVSLLGMAGLVFALFYPTLTAIPITAHALETYTNIANAITGH